MRDYWYGDVITALAPNEILVFGSNPEGRHGKGIAKLATRFGAQYGKPRGLSGQTYGLVTKNLRPGVVEIDTGYSYPKAGYQSITLSQIRYNVCELYEYATNHPTLRFLIPYKNESQKSLCGYSGREIVEQCFMTQLTPPNIIFHESFKELSK